MDSSNDAECLAVARRFMAALNVADEKTVREVYAPDALIWHNFDGKEQTVDENVKSMHWMHRKLSNINYDIQRQVAFRGGFVQQHVLRGTLPSGDDFAMAACAVVTVENGRITRLEEYLDSAATQPLLAR